MDLPSIVGASLRDVIETSVTDRVLPYRILSLGHLSSWNTFQRDLTEIFRRHSTFDEQVFFLCFRCLSDELLLVSLQGSFYSACCTLFIVQTV